MSDSKAVGKPCTFCNGDGFTAEHGCSPLDTTGQDCAMNCPVQVQCEHCNGTGVEPAPTSDSKGAAIEKIIQDIEDYCVVGALGGTPFNTQEENDKLREDAVDKGRTKAKQAILAILAQEVKRVRIDELTNFEPFFKGDHSKCPNASSCIGYQNAQSDFDNEKEIRLSKLRGAKL